MYTNDLVKKYDTVPMAGNPREVEAWALTQASLRMMDAKKGGDHDEIKGAIRLNWQLWTIIQSELFEPNCPLPQDIRTNMLSLAAFVDKQSMALIANPTGGSMVDTLVNINRELAAGLRENNAPEGAPQPQAPAGTPAAPLPPDGSKLTDTSA